MIADTYPITVSTKGINSSKFTVPDSGIRHYVASFSEEPDSVPLWTYYSKMNGCSVEYTPKSFQTPGVRLFRVIYDPNEQRKIARKILEIIVDRCRNPGMAEWVNLILSVVMDTMMLYFKHDYFSFEKEVRAVYETNDKKGVKYRVNSDMICPYYEVKLVETNSCTVICGPLHKSREEMELFLYSAGKEDYIVNKSRVGIRF